MIHLTPAQLSALGIVACLGSVAAQTSSILCFVAAVTLAAQTKPDFTGTWELTTIEEKSHRFPPRTGYKEMQVWAQRELNLNIRMIIVSNGSYKLELTYFICDKSGPVGSGVSVTDRKML
jgi:hypothetical protein